MTALEHTLDRLVAAWRRIQFPDDWKQGEAHAAVERLARGLPVSVGDAGELDDLLASADIPDLLDDDALASIEESLSGPTGAEPEVRQ